MKKLRLSNIFHWLYAFIMFIPVLVVLSKLVTSFGTGGEVMSLQAFSGYFESGVFSFGGISDSICLVYSYLLDDILSFGEMSDCICSLLTYWTVVSCGYLIFDILMFPINLAHRWIDKGGIE